MILKSWDKLPLHMQNDCVRECYDILNNKRFQLSCKKIMDITLALILIIIFAPLMLIVAVVIKIDSPGSVMFRQIRVTRYGKHFRIFKFRTMITDADVHGEQVTIKDDNRITRAGKFLRRYRLDEIPQLYNIFPRWDMSFVGTRPEVPKYVAQYSDEMKVTLLLPAGITSEASIRYKDEDALLAGSDDPSEVYIKSVLPEKMKYNIEAIQNYWFFSDVITMIHTVIKVFH